MCSHWNEEVTKVKRSRKRLSWLTHDDMYPMPETSDHANYIINRIQVGKQGGGEVRMGGGGWGG